VTAPLGSPRLHLRRTDSTNERARKLATAGAPHGALVTAGEQTAGRGRQGRAWTAPPGRALLLSLVLRGPEPALVPLAAGVAVAEAVGPDARIKWPNDVLVDGRKVAGILVEGRPQEGWAVLGIGLNVAVRLEDLPAELRKTAGTLGREPTDLEPTLVAVLRALERWLDAGQDEVIAAWRERDALEGRRVEWAEGAGKAVGIDDGGRLLVGTSSGTIALDAGEVHLTATPPRASRSRNEG
jgi:BirA family transcriptional regulator, biotin operon repressor / biotin---[acetyl-CoA-carboxylase] ligase